MNFQYNNKVKFIYLWIGQSISILGSSVAGFALALWVYEKTGVPGHLALLTFAHFCPRIYLSIFAGHFIDTFSRKTILQLCNIGFILTSLWLLFLINMDSPSIYLLVLVNFIAGLFSCFKALTFQTTVSTFIDKDDWLKYNGFVSILTNIPILLGPALGGVLLSVITMREIIIIDIGTFLVNLIITTLIIFPRTNYKSIKKFQWKQIIFGTKYIFKNRTLKTILLIFTYENFFTGLTIGLVTPFLLAKTNGDNLLTAYNSSLIALGGIIGGVIIFKMAQFIRKPLQIALAGFFLVGLIGRVATGLMSSIFLIGLFLMIRNIIIPIVNASCETIWQKETPLEYQGRVFGARRFFAQGGIPIALF